MFVGRGTTGNYYIIFQLSDYRRSIAAWVKIEGKRMINRIISYGGLKNGTICLLCPNCLSGVYAKFGTYSRRVRYYLGHLRTICVQRYHCKCCNSTFSDLSRIVSHLRRYAKKALRDIVDIKLWMGAGLGKIANWKRARGCSSTLIWNELQKLGKLCKEAFKKLRCKFSGTVCIDEVWVRQIKGKYVYVFAAIDAMYGQVIWINSFIVENKGEKSIAAETFLNELKAMGFSPKVILTDGDNCYPEAIKQVFKKAVHQLCIFHVKKNIYDAFELPKGMKLSKELEELRDMILAIFDVDNISKKDAVEFLKSALKSAIDLKWGSVVKLLKNLIEKKDRLFQYLEYNIPKSTGFVESLFSFFEPIQDIGKSFPSKESVDNIFTAVAMHYNFGIKIQSKFNDPIPVRRAGYRGTLDMYDFVKYEC
jgi:transposase-like protein